RRAMPVEFTMFPSNWRPPLYWAEIDPSKAGTATLDLPALLVGQMFSTGTAAPDVPIAVGNIEMAQAYFGLGSMLERMVNTFFANNPAQILWAVGILEPSAGQPAKGSIQVNTPATAPGTLTLYIAGQRIQVPVSAEDTPAIVAQTIAAKINATATLPVTATTPVVADTVDLTCKWKGLTGNDIDLRDSYRGSAGGELRPVGLTLTYVKMGSAAGAGSGTPSFTNTITNLGEKLYEYVALPFTDSASLDDWQTEYAFTSSGRWGWMRQLYGQLYSAKRDLYSAHMTWYATQN